MDDDKILIIMTSGPDTPRRCATPFFLATLATVMEHEVTMFFTIDGTLLLKKGMAETIYPKKDGKPVSDFLKDAVDAGIEMLACSASMELHGLTQDDLLDGVKTVGGAKMWELVEDHKVLTF